MHQQNNYKLRNDIIQMSKRIRIRDILFSYETAYINEAIRYHHVNKTSAFKALGVTRNYLYLVLNKEGFNKLELKVSYEPKISLREAKKKFEDSIVCDLKESLKRRGIMED